MKTFFHGHGWRETKVWACDNCNNFWTSGMDLCVDERKKRHQETCPGKKPKVECSMFIDSSYPSIVQRMATAIEEALHRGRKIIAATIAADTKFYGSLFWTESE